MHRRWEPEPYDTLQLLLNVLDPVRRGLYFHVAAYIGEYSNITAL